MPAQYLRGSLFQYQLDAFALNPAIAGSTGALNFDASYLSNFASGNTLSRAAIVSVHGISGEKNQTGIGGLMQFFKTTQFGELGIKPSFSWQLPLRKNHFAIGIASGINYFDFEDDGTGVIPENFASFEGGAGIHFFSEHIFAGLAMPNLFELTLGSVENDLAYIPRERNLNLHLGGIFRIYENIKARPVALLRAGNIYRLPDIRSVAQVEQTFRAFDFQASFLIDDTYLIGLLYGLSDFSRTETLNRMGVSATLILGQFHLGYAVQRNGGEQFGVELPVSHLFSLGYVFVPNDRTNSASD
jgi:hypothetical protein